MKIRIIQSLLSVGLALSLVAPSARGQDSQRDSQQRDSGSSVSQTLVDRSVNTGRPMNLLVLGDSIMWGQGLRSENKSWHLVKIWLAQHTGRTVIERIEAHAGAVIEAQGSEETKLPPDGEINFDLPTVVEQLDHALRYYAVRPEVDVVLLSACANDVDWRNVIDAGKSTEQIRLLTEAKCRVPMQSLLRKVITSFPAAYVIVTGYYPFISEQTRNDIFMKALTKKFFTAAPGATELTRETTFKRIIANSEQWYRSSNASLSEAVRTVNAELGAQTSPRRVMFAEIHFLPEHSFRAPRTKLWDFENSPLRKLLVFLSLGKVLLRTNDEVRNQRAASCKQFWQAPPGETPEQKKERKNKELVCRYAALGHPNRKGALTYAEAIIEQLKNQVTIANPK